MKSGLLLLFTMLLLTACKNPLGSGSSSEQDFDPGTGGGGETPADTTAPLAVGSVDIVANDGGLDRSVSVDWSASPGSDNSGSWSYQIAIGYDNEGDGFDSGNVDNLVSWTTLSGGNATTSYQVINGSASFSFSPQFNQAHYTSIRLIDAANNVSSATSSSAWYTFIPSQISDLEIWLDGTDTSQMFTNTACTTAASSIGDTVACWQDKSNNNYHMTSAVNNPVRGTNGVSFDGNDDILSNSAIALNADSDISFFIATTVGLQSNDTGSCCRPFLSWVTASSALYPWLGMTRGNLTPGNNLFFGWQGVGLSYTPTTNGESYIVGAKHDGTNNQWNTYLNGTQNVTNQTIPASYGTTTDLSIGGDISNTARKFNGQILEVIMVDGIINSTLQEDIEGYLACKWDLRSRLNAGHSFYNADDSSDEGCP